ALRGRAGARPRRVLRLPAALRALARIDRVGPDHARPDCVLVPQLVLAEVELEEVRPPLRIESGRRPPLLRLVELIRKLIALYLQPPGGDRITGMEIAGCGESERARG